MDNYFMDQIIDSYTQCFEHGDCDGDYYDGFDYDPNFYHYRVRFKIAHETDKAYLFEVKEGQFWCPKSLLRNVRRDGDRIRALLWDGFERTLIQPQPKVVDEFDIEPEPDIEKDMATIKKRVKPMTQRKVVMISTPSGYDKTVYDAEWAKNEGLI